MAYGQAPQMQSETAVSQGVMRGVTQGTMQKTIMLLDGEYFTLDVAITKAELLQGLMYRDHLPQKTGMLFPFYPARTVNFWMKNTLIPLDMVFLRNQQVVHLVTDAVPCMGDPCPSYNSLVPVDMVVELPAGTVRQYSIDYGDPVQFMSAYHSRPEQTKPEGIHVTGDEAGVQVIDIPVLPEKPINSNLNDLEPPTEPHVPVQSILDHKGESIPQ